MCVCVFSVYHLYWLASASTAILKATVRALTSKVNVLFMVPSLLQAFNSTLKICPLWLGSLLDALLGVFSGS